MSVTPHAERNSAYWDTLADVYADNARRNWAQNGIEWGIWNVPESSLGVLDDVGGADVVELGCGTAYFSAWLARRGARPTGVDLNERQLATAREMQAQHGLDFPLVRASAENVPLEDASFDLALSEYGASIWCDPFLWIPEAARLLRPGGVLVYLTNGVLPTLTWHDDAEPSGDRLVRDYFGMHAFPWDDGTATNFYLGYGETIRLLRANGLEVEGLWHLQAPPDAESRDGAPVTGEWSKRWPSEEIWKARKL